MRGDLPSGTVTLVFTDIEGSTRLLYELGDRYAGALAEHRRIIRDVFGREGGLEVDNQGDAFFFAFDRASAAVSAAIAAQEALAEGPVRVRMGLHTGEPMVTDEGYVGLDVHVAARVAGSGHGGQIVVSARTRDLVATGAAFTDLGAHRLKDVAEPVRLFQVGDAPFPALTSLSPSTLPHPVTSFVGRERELADGAALIEEARLVTITGAGGAGKTRFAIELANRVQDGFPDGVFWVPLASIRAPDLVLASAELAMGTRGGLTRHVAERRMLLLFDNFEQVVSAAPDLAGLLPTCPNLRLLVTSRELLHVAGERELALPSLNDDEGAALFAERASVAAGTQSRELCRRLDGLPLAIELAAARARVLSLDDLLGRLPNRLDLLKGGRDADPRQATLRATIQWSYDLLSPEEQSLFASLSIFAGGCTLGAAEAVAHADVDTLQSLFDKSLVRRSAGRYWMLETIRGYAAERLAESGDAEAVAAAHAAYFLDLAEAANLDQFSEEPSAGLSGFVEERANVLAALEWALRTGDAELGLRFAVALGTFWVVGDPREGMRWFEAFFDLESALPAGLRATALRAYGGVANHAGDDALAEQLFQESLAEYRRLGDEPGVAVVLVHLAHSTWYRGDVETAVLLGTQAREQGRRLGNRSVEIQATGVLGDLAFEQGSADEGLRLLEASAAEAGESGFLWWRGRMLLRMAKRARQLGRGEDALRWGMESLRLAVAIADHRRIVQVIDLLAVLAADRGDLDRAGWLYGVVQAELERDPLTAWSISDLPAAVLADPGFDRNRSEGAVAGLEDALDSVLRPE